MIHYYKECEYDKLIFSKISIIFTCQHNSEFLISILSNPHRDFDLPDEELQKKRRELLQEMRRRETIVRESKEEAVGHAEERKRCFIRFSKVFTALW